MKLKRIVRVIIGVCYFALMKAGGVVLSIGGKWKQSRCTVLYYHSIESRHRARFAKQMDVLLRYSTPISADTRLSLPPGRRYSVVTFDDGFQNVIDNALPELEKRKIPFTVFVIAGALGKAVPWSTKESPHSAPAAIMPEVQLRSIPTSLMTIGAHTMTHPRLPAIAADQAMWEIRESKSRLEAILGAKVTLFSFPYGAFSEKLIRQCHEAGFERVFTTLPGVAFSNPAEFVTGRIGLEVTDWPLEFRLKVLGAYNWLPAAFILKRKVLGWLTFGADRMHSHREARG